MFYFNIQSFEKFFDWKISCISIYFVLAAHKKISKDYKKLLFQNLLIKLSCVCKGSIVVTRGKYKFGSVIKKFLMLYVISEILCH